MSCSSQVQILLIRLIEHPEDPEIIQTCCSALTMLSRDEARKLEIATDGLQPLLACLSRHVANPIVLESVCDLLWNLAFNNRQIKVAIGKQNGIDPLIVAMSKHLPNRDLIKSSLGTISNLCQIPQNQIQIGQLNGLTVLLNIIQVHASNRELLTLAFDALASVMIGNTPNIIQTQELKGLQIILPILDKHRNAASVLKSGCHVLAIFGNVQGHGRLLAQTNAVKTIIQSLSAHPDFRELDKIAIVVLLRILNESQVSAQLLHQGTMQIMFRILKQPDLTEETAAAAAHIIYQMTESAVINKLDLNMYMRPLQCSSEIVFQAIRQTSSTNLTRTLFRVLANCVRSTEPVAFMITFEGLEAMLEIVLTQSKIPDIIDCVITCFCFFRFDFDGQKALEMNKQETTLAGLLLCIRSRAENIELIEKAFGFLKLWIKTLSSKRKHQLDSNATRGFVSIALRCMSQFAVPPLAPFNVVEPICEYLVEIMSISKGLEMVKDCGGYAIAQSTYKSLKKNHPNKDLVQLTRKIVMTLMDSTDLLNSAIEKEYQDYTNYLQKKQQQQLSSSEHNQQEEEQVQEAEDGDDDVASEEEEPQQDPEVTQSKRASRADSSPEAPATQAIGVPAVVQASKTKGPRKEHFDALDFAYLEKTTKVCYPKHPLAEYSHPNDAPNVPKHQLLHSSPIEPEDCYEDTKSLRLLTYVETQMTRRKQFVNELAQNPNLQIVYENASAAGSNIASRVPEPYPYQVLSSSSTCEYSLPPLSFDSEFESGNLLRAIRIGEAEYDLVLRADVHTSQYMQWFYFAISNVHVPRNQSAQSYEFHLLNLCKPDSQFNHGLLPVVYSVQDALDQKKGWTRTGRNVCYYANPFPRPASTTASSSTYYTLSFTLDLANEQDTYLVAHSYPYTLTQHRQHMNALLKTPKIDLVFQRKLLCLTLGGHECDVLTITDFTASASTLEKRKSIILSSRVHPGETQASWMMKGTIDFLVGGSIEAKLLRELFIFTIVPVLNPDGVFYGNNRCGLSACDLNRQWRRPNKAIHPTVYHTKALIRRENATRDVCLYIDMHGHSRKKNIFMYGCDNKKKPNPKVKIFPQMLANNEHGKEYVSFKDCSFKVNKGREATARVVVAREFQIVNSFTLEASFCGADFGALNQKHFHLDHFQQIGYAVGHTIFEFIVPKAELRQVLVSNFDRCSLNFDILRKLEQDTPPPSSSLPLQIPKLRASPNGLQYSSMNQDSPTIKTSKRKKQPKQYHKDPAVAAEIAKLKAGFLPASTPTRRVRTAQKQPPSSRSVLKMELTNLPRTFGRKKTTSSKVSKTLALRAATAQEFNPRR